jgi:UDP-N-acetylglucosamine diphosphorylase/glucosamine-1-phosphate N-acetyltransferase
MFVVTFIKKIQPYNIMQVILFDQPDFHQQLLPLTYTRPISELRIGIITIKEKWEKRLNTSIAYLTADYLSTKYPLVVDTDNLLINASVVANDQITTEIQSIGLNQVLVKDGVVIAARLLAANVRDFDMASSFKGERIESKSDFILVNRPWHIFEHNGTALQEDFDYLTAGRTSQPISDTNRVAGAENIFLEAGASVEFSILNATTGPIYVGKNAQIMENSTVRGSLAMNESSVLKMGAKIYGPTTLGPHCKVGGEVSNSVLTGYSNKGHEGYLGNSVLGEWCNLGADTNTSNLKNNYQPVKLWNYSTGRFADTGLQFCGLIMGDHSKCGINTMFNTGTVVGVSANIYGAGFPRNYIPSYSWGGASGFTTYRFDKAMETAKVMMARRKKELDEVELAILKYTFDNK